MKVAFYMNCVSAHQLPLAKEVVGLVGSENFCYVDAGEKSESAQSAETQGLKFKVQRVEDAAAETAAVRGDSAREWLETAGVMLTGMRDLGLFERRAKRGGRTYYTSERWYKPVHIARLLAIGPWAKKDFLRMGVRAEKIVDWGYFVERRLGLKDQGLGPDKLNNLKSNNQTILNVLWCGRMLGLKRVDTIIRAVARIREEGRWMG